MGDLRQVTLVRFVMINRLQAIFPERRGADGRCHWLLNCNSLAQMRNIFFKYGLLITCVAATLAQSAWAAPFMITPYLGPFGPRPGNWSCRSVTLDQGNVIGMLASPLDGQTVQARILFRSSPKRGLIEMRMMRQDANLLQDEVAALLAKQRPRPIRFQARLDRERNCEIYQVSG